MTCIVRCNFEDSSDTEGTCTISNSDVTMGVKGETFQISLRDADGNKITGLLWVSSDLSVCSVDGTGIVKAEGKGTAYISTTYNGVTYQCLVRCNIKIIIKKQRTQEPPASAVFMPPDGCASGTAL